MDWIEKADTFYANSYVVHEVMCLVCKVSVTYIKDNVPKYCYVCEEDRSLKGS